MACEFSIIIPAYNSARYLREALDSVLGQSNVNWEAICVDDGSTDATGAILDEYAARDARFRVIHQVNSGVSISRNVAMEAAKGDWICFLDADDAWRPTILEEIGLIISAHDVDLIVIDLIHGVDCSQVIWTRGETYNKSFVKVERTYEEALGIYGKTLQMQIWRNFIRRSKIGAVRFKERASMWEDALFLSELICNVGNICKFDFNGYFYRANPSSATSSGHPTRCVEPFLDGVSEAFERLMNSSMSKVDVLAIMNFYSRSIDSMMCQWCRYSDFWDFMPSRCYLKYRDLRFRTFQKSIPCVGLSHVCSQLARWCPSPQLLKSIMLCVYGYRKVLRSAKCLVPSA